MPVAQEVYWTPKEVADRFRVTEQTVRNYIKRGQLKAIRFGDNLRITEDAVQEFINKKQNK
jgi:excisionase family DNA binding protein